MNHTININIFKRIKIIWILILILKTGKKIVHEHFLIGNASVYKNRREFQVERVFEFEYLMVLPIRTCLVHLKIEPANCE